MQAALLKDNDTATLAALNEGYVRAVQHSDAPWFRENLAHDFLNTDSQGAQADREGYIREVTRPPSFTGLTLADAAVRVFGDFAVIHGRTTFVKPGGEPGAGSYTDVWARRNGRWVCIAAQVLRR